MKESWKALKKRKNNFMWTNPKQRQCRKVIIQRRLSTIIKMEELLDIKTCEILKLAFEYEPLELFLVTNFCF
jgi:hypothetical protein